MPRGDEAFGVQARPQYDASASSFDEAGARSLRITSGGVVFEEGEEGGSLYFVRSGEVELARRGAAGALPVARLGKGEFFGEQGVLVPGPRRSRAVVVRDAELLEVGAGAFERMCLERPDIAVRIARGLAARAQGLEQRLAGVEGEDAVRALARTLVRLSRSESEEAVVEGTLRSLALEAGLGLLEAHHALQQLVERKQVRLVDDVLRISDPEALSILPHGAASPDAGR